MDKYIYDDKNGLWHKPQGDYLFLVLLTDTRHFLVHRSLIFFSPFPHSVQNRV